MKILSLGAGVQSTTLALMSIEGEFGDRPDYMIFADTEWEPKKVYQHLDRLEEIVKPYGIPILRVSAGNIRDAALSGVRFASMPLFTQSRSGATTITWIPPEEFELSAEQSHIPQKRKNGAYSKLRRQCTKEFKLMPIMKETRRLLGLKPRQRVPEGTCVEMWVGISTDEWERAKPSRDWWIKNRHPLLEEKMSRRDCLAWLSSRGYDEPPKSSCIGCPFHDDLFWRAMRDNDPDEWEDACEFDEAIRHSLRLMKSPVFLHRSLKPLREVDLSTAEERGQISLKMYGFANDCEGVCGV